MAHGVFYSADRALSSVRRDAARRKDQNVLQPRRLSNPFQSACLSSGAKQDFHCDILPVWFIDAALRF